MKFRAWIENVMSNADQASFGRFASFICLIFCLGWDTAIVVFSMMHYQQMHIAVRDLYPDALMLAGQTAFCSAWYGINKLRDANQDQYKKDSPAPTGQ
jgi:hypothetical protein